MSNDPRVLVLEEMRKQTALLYSIHENSLTMMTALSRMLEAFPKNVAPDANDSVCNGPHGDPIVKAKDPRDWTGDPMKGRKFSECPPTYLELLADRYDYFMERAEAAKKDADDDEQLQKAEKDAKYAKLDAARARGWAARLRAGWTAPAPAAQGFSDGGF